jgi:hypothetical protein
VATTATARMRFGPPFVRGVRLLPMAELTQGLADYWAHLKQGARVRGSPKFSSRRRRLCTQRLLETVFEHLSHLTAGLIDPWTCLLNQGPPFVVPRNYARFA